MVLAEQLGDDSWYGIHVQLAAIWHWYLPLFIYIKKMIMFVFVHFLYIYFFSNLVLIN